MQKIVNEIVESIKTLRTKTENKTLIVAIDGRCGAGKTTLAGLLEEEFNCAAFHMDDFFPRPEQRTEERLSIPGENVDHERFLEEVMRPLLENRSFYYRPYDCRSQELTEPIYAEPNDIAVVEGSYSCHPALWGFYDLRIFLTVEPKEQLRRIVERNGAEKAEMFKKRWIPLEEKYFAAFDIENRCDLRFSTDI